MNGISLCVILSIFHVVLSEQIPPHCRAPPPEVKNPRDCCKSARIFSEEDLKACGIEKDGKQIPDCSKHICLLNQYSLMKDENTVDKEALAAFLDKYTEKNADFKDAVESAKDVCLKDDLLGLPEICEVNKIVLCFVGNIFMNCPNWDDTDNCKKVKNHFEECKKYYY